MTQVPIHSTRSSFFHFAIRNRSRSRSTSRHSRRSRSTSRHSRRTRSPTRSKWFPFELLFLYPINLTPFIQCFLILGQNPFRVDRHRNLIAVSRADVHGIVRIRAIDPATFRVTVRYRLLVREAGNWHMRQFIFVFNWVIHLFFFVSISGRRNEVLAREQTAMIKRKRKKEFLFFE